MNFRNFTVLSLIILVSGCATYGKVVIEDEDGTVILEGDRRGEYYHERAHDHAYDIPPGHLPPPGSCRIWFPGNPPGQQPPPGDCYELERNVPRGAWLIRG